MNTTHNRKKLITSALGEGTAAAQPSINPSPVICLGGVILYVQQ